MRPVIVRKPSSSREPMSPEWEPAVDDRGLGRVGVLEVLVQDLDALDEDLAVVGDPDPGSRQGLADRADLDAVRRVDGRGRRRLGQAVALEHDQPDPAEEVAQAGAQWSAAADGVRHPPAHAFADLPVDEPIEDRMLQPQAETRAAGVPGRAVVDGDLGRAAEDSATAVALGALLGGVVDLLEDPRDAQDERGTELAQRVRQLGGVRQVPHRHGVDHAEGFDEPCEHVGQGEEEQGRRSGRHDLAERRGAVADQVDEVAVGEDASFGAPGRPGRVDDRRRSGTVTPRAGGGQRVVGQVGARLGDGFQAVVQDPRVREIGQLGRDGLDDALVVRRLDEDRHGFGVGEDPPHLLGGGGLVDRDGHGSRGPDREVAERPFVAGPRHEPHPVTGLHTLGDEAPGQ